VPAPGTPWVNPGVYTVRLTVNGQTYSQPITVKQDPRVKTAPLVMQQVYSLTASAYYGAIDALQAAQQLQNVRDQITTLQAKATGGAATALAAFQKRLETAFSTATPPAAAAAASPAAGGAPAAGRGGRGGRGGAAGGPAGPANALSSASASLTGVMNSLQGADVRPTALQVKAMNDALAAYRAAMAKWTAVRNVDVRSLNATLTAAGLAPITVR